MSETDVLYERPGAVAILTLNRPDRLNAFTHAMEEQYFELLDRADADPAVRAIVVTGAGRGFCAGGDVEMLRETGEGAPPKPASERRPQVDTHRIRKPLIAAINGPCAGIGFVMALACDVRFAARGTTFTTSFARRGLAAEHGIEWLLTRLVGTGRALDLLLSGRRFLAEEAHELGIVNWLSSPGASLDDALQYAQDLATNCSPMSMAAIKEQVYACQGATLEETLASSSAVALALIGTADHREGIASFVERRSPAFAALGEA